MLRPLTTTKVRVHLQHSLRPSLHLQRLLAQTVLRTLLGRRPVPVAVGPSARARVQPAALARDERGLPVHLVRVRVRVRGRSRGGVRARVRVRARVAWNWLGLG